MNNMFTRLLRAKTPYVVGLFAGLLCITGCKKEEVDDTVYSAVSVFNGSPTASTYDVYLDGNKINSSALPLGGSIPYSQQTAGGHNIKFTIAGRTETAYTKDFSFPGSAYTSVFLIGKPSAFDSFAVTDDLSATSTTQAFVRFVNVSPDAPALDLYLAGGASLVTGQAYKTASKFVAIDPGAKVLDVKQGSTVKTSTASFTFVAGYKYTILLRGLVNPTSTDEVALGAQVVLVK